MLGIRTASVLALLGALAAPALAQGEIDFEASVWDLSLGQHARELPTAQFAEFACGTNGGPPSTRIDSWTDFARCRPEAATGWREVYFQYDDLYEYVALARGDMQRAALYANTSVYSRPVIASVLFDDDGFMRGLRLVTDPRVDTRTREEAYTLGGFLQARYDGDWQCESLPRLDGETPFRGIFIKRLCTLVDDQTGVTRTIETHFYRRPGQTLFDANNIPTEGYFESLARLEEFLVADIPDREARLAAIEALPMAEEDPLVLQAMDCPGCNLSGAILRRADLRGANLAGANLEGASFHAANLAGANLAGANLTNTNFNKATLTQANLSGAELSGAMLYEARLDGADLSGITAVTILAGHARMIRVDLTDAVILDSDLTSVFMTNATAVGATIARSRLWEARMSRSDFTGAVLTRSDMALAVMTSIILVDADMRISNLTGADLRDGDLANADLSGAVLDTAILARTNVEGANFEGAQLPGGFNPP